MIILSIETSCDETAVSVVEAKGDLESLNFKLLGSALHSQIDIHKEFGGVVPRLAKREHTKNLPLVLEQALRKSGLDPKNPSFEPQDSRFPIDLIAVTVGPGLEPALWTGITFAKDLGEKWGVRVVGANHMEGHIASVLLNKTDASTKSEIRNPKESFGFGASNLEFPAIALLVSGGHTELVFLKNWKEKEKIGETRDDAVGEAFDKVARMLGLPYPGGPEISRLAQEAREKNIILETRFPRPMLHSKDFDFSFSGLKTAVLYYLRELRNSSVNEPCELDEASTRNFSAEKYPCERTEAISQLERMMVAREFEDAVIETLLTKTKLAIEKYDPKTLVIGGGVIANTALRENFLNLKNDFPDLEILIPEKSLTTDNATMIAIAAYIEHLANPSLSLPLSASGNLQI